MSALDEQRRPLSREELARQVEEALTQVKEAHDTLEALVNEMREEGHDAEL